MARKKACFVIAPIGDDGSETRKRSDQILDHVIKPAVGACGYTAIRADKIEKPGVITSQVIQHVVEDDLVVADLTDRNPNVFYELAVRHAIRKPFIHLIQKGERIPFDVAGTRTVFVDHHDLDSVAAAKSEIENQIKSIEDGSAQIETPISVSLDLQILRQSDDPKQRSLADIMSAITELPSRIEQRFSEEAEPIKRRRFRKFHPMMIEEMSHLLGREITPSFGILLLSSYLRDDAPWLYELGAEAFRASVSGNHAKTEKILRLLRHAMEFTMHGPLGEELMMSTRETHMLVHELQRHIDHSIEACTRGRLENQGESSERGIVAESRYFR